MIINLLGELTEICEKEKKQNKIKEKNFRDRGLNSGPITDRAI